MLARALGIVIGALLVARSAQAHSASEGQSPLDLLVWLLLAALLLLYVAGMSRLWRRSGAGLRRRETFYFMSGWTVLAIALVSPVDALSERLFFVHMIQHELLMLIAAPLLVFSRPLAPWLHALPRRARRVMAKGVFGTASRTAVRALTRPLTAWCLQAAVLWLWHVPVLFDAATTRDSVHIAQHASFFAAALLYWWSVSPGRSGVHPGAAVLSLFATMLHSNLLGALLTFSPVAWYAYPDHAGGGLSRVEDQQLGGLIMWIPAGLAYLYGGLAVIARTLRLSGLERLHHSLR